MFLISSETKLADRTSLSSSRRRGQFSPAAHECLLSVFKQLNRRVRLETEHVLNGLTEGQSWHFRSILKYSDTLKSPEQRIGIKSPFLQ
jgi:hypothetical protein